MPTIDTTAPRVGQLGDFVGVWIREARGQRQWSQGDLANRLDRPQSMISRWERGRAVPSVAEWVQVCAALGRNPADALSRVIQNENNALPLFAQK
jgi:ribosome-binding protein aMBF1 (putative translation factor)